MSDQNQKRQKTASRFCDYSNSRSAMSHLSVASTAIEEALAGPGLNSGPERSIDGWVLFVSGIHREAQKDDILDAFSDYGKVKTVSINPDKRTGFVKGYALVEYDEFSEAQDAINELHGKTLLGKTIKVDWAFVKPR